METAEVNVSDNGDGGGAEVPLTGLSDDHEYLLAFVREHAALADRAIKDSG